MSPERAVQMRLDHLQDKAHGGGCIKRSAALFQDRHADGRGDPVGRGGDAKGAADFGPGGEIA